MLEEGRLARGLTQREAAVRLDVSSPYLNRLEHGIYCNPSPRILIAAAELYGIPQADLFAAVGYLSPSELPTLSAYLRATCKDLPDAAISEMVHYCEYIQRQHRGGQKIAGLISEQES